MGGRIWKTILMKKLRINASKSKIMKYMRVVEDRRMYAVFNGELLEEVNCSKYLVSHVTVDGRINVEVKPSVNEVEVVGERRRIF